MTDDFVIHHPFGMPTPYHDCHKHWDITRCTDEEYGEAWWEMNGPRDIHESIDYCPWCGIDLEKTYQEWIATRGTETTP